MTRQVIALGVRPFSLTANWTGAVRLDPALVAGGGEAWLRELGTDGVTITLRLAASATAEPGDAGPHLSAALAAYETALSFAEGDGAPVTLPGPTWADNLFSDSTEPYLWNPGDPRDAFATWVGRLGDGAVTLTLDDGVEPRPAALGLALALGQPARPPLTLDRFDRSGLAFDALALIEAGADGSTIFASPPRGTVGALLDGELGLGAGEVPITRIRRQASGAILLVNTTGSITLRDYFSAGGAGGDLRLYVQTHDGVASSPVTVRGSAGGGYYQLGRFGDDLTTLVAGIAEGDRFIIAFARKRPAAEATPLPIGLALASPEEAIRARPSPLRPGLALAPAIALDKVRPAALGLGIALASPTKAAERVKASPSALGIGLGLAPPAARVKAQPAALDLGLVLAPPVARDKARAAALRIGLALVEPAFLERAVRYGRALRASAPEHALLTALEISHPAIALPVRVVNDTRNRRIEGADYVALRFDARLADDVDGQAPQAELAIDNVGRALTQWIEAAGGGVGASVRVMLVLDIDDAPVEWEVTLDVASMAVDQERVTARLGFDPLLGRAAVTLRHDPQTSPGLF